MADEGRTLRGTYRPGAWPIALALTAAWAGSALAADPVDYTAYRQGAFLPFINAPDNSATPARVPKLLVSFGGGEARPIVMDTGSTGIVISADRIPDIDALPAQPGRLTYSSSGRIMIGRWVTTPLRILGRDGTGIDVQPIPVLAVDRIACTQQARNCRPEEAPRGVAMMGVGFGREYDSQSESTPDKNPLLNLKPTGEPARRGYVVSRAGVQVGLTQRATAGGFRYVKLDPHESIRGEWQGVPVCIGLDDGSPSCGRALIDTGVTAMFLTLPPDAVRDAVSPDEDGPPALAEGTRLTFSFPGAADQPAAEYELMAGDEGAPMAPTRIHLNTRRPQPFVNTSVRFLDGFDVLYDADGGYFGFRRRGR